MVAIIAITITTIRITMPSITLKRLRLPSVYGVEEIEDSLKKRRILNGSHYHTEGLSEASIATKVFSSVSA